MDGEIVGDVVTDIIKIEEKPMVRISTINRDGEKVSRHPPRRRQGEYHRDPAAPKTFQWMGWTGGSVG